MEYYTEFVTLLATLAANLVIFIRVLNKKLQPIKENSEVTRHQVERNSGASLADAISRIEANTNELKGWFRGIHQINPNPIYQTDQAGYYIWVNPAYTKLVGATASDLLFKSWLSVVYSQDKARVLQEWEAAVEAKATFDCKFKMVNLLDDHHFDVRSIAYPVFSKDNLIGYIGTITLMNPLSGCPILNNENVRIVKNDGSI